MALSSGRKLGPYEILAPIGAGGMGEVYKAKDTRLDRTVAIKVLPSHLAGDSGLRKRFEQEARAVASLNHPHICILHDVGREDGVDFIVMEYLEGETLAERLKKGALPVDEVLRYGIQITDALDKAHRRGIVHRDLKPGNVMLTPSGPKLLDFGLAKMGMPDPASAASSLSALPTAAKALTAEGAIIGTFQYMAPEQLEAQEVDARTDIFALGALLYEMATGRKAFEGKSQASLIGAIMKSDPPPVSQLQSAAPPALDHVIRRCLAKDLEDRWQAARDINRELSWIAEGGAPSEPTTPVERASAQRERMTWVAGLVLASAVSVLATWAFVRPDPPLVRRLAMNVLFEATPDPSTRPALSPDGRNVVYAADVDGVRLLYIRPLDQVEARPLPGTEGAYNPFFSPDGEWVAFFTDPATGGGKLKRVSVRGGPPLTLCDARWPMGSWGGDGTIVFVHSSGDTDTDRILHRVPAAGGTPEPITELDPEQGELRHGWPEVLPGGESVVFSISVGEDPTFRDSRLAVLSLSTGEYRTVVEQGHHARYAESGHLVYSLSGVLTAAPFDLGRLETTGPPVPILEGVVEISDSARCSSTSPRTGRSPTFRAGPKEGLCERSSGWTATGARSPWPRNLAPICIHASRRTERAWPSTFETRRTTSGSGISIATRSPGSLSTGLEINTRCGLLTERGSCSARSPRGYGICSGKQRMEPEPPSGWPKVRIFNCQFQSLQMGSVWFFVRTLPTEGSTCSCFPSPGSKVSSPS